ncbi:MAG: DUF4846 domain-containing protein, partial [Verrucomicrobiales bacterium]
MLRILSLLPLLISTALAEDRIVSHLPLPEGYARHSYPEGSYSRWLQSAPLKRDKTIALHDGRHYEEGSNWYKIAAVLDFPLLFDQNLEQCADFAMRLWAEYHAATGQLDRLFLYHYDGK